MELFFYLLYPFIIVLCLFCRNRVWTLLLVFVALTLVRQLPHAWLAGVIPMSRQSAGFTSMFVAGVLAAAVAKKSPGLLDNKLLQRNALTLISFLVLFVIVAFVARSNLPQDSVWKLQWLLSPLFFVMFISLVRSDGIASRLLSSRVGITLGHVSFSLYLVHIIAYNIVTAYLGERYQGILAAVVVLFVMTSVYYALFERPFVRLSKRITVSDKFGWRVRSAAEVSRPKPSA